MFCLARASGVRFAIRGGTPVVPFDLVGMRSVYNTLRSAMPGLRPVLLKRSQSVPNQPGRCVLNE